MKSCNVMRTASTSCFSSASSRALPTWAGSTSTLHTPRRASPRLEVPAGSVGIGGEQTGIYPATSPGGWQLIGRTELPLFDPARRPPTLLQPGDRVRFTVAGIHA